MTYPMPARFHLEQEKWDACSDHMKSDIHRTIAEMTAGLEASRAAAKRYVDLKEFHELAERQGTTVAAALRRYIDMENEIRANPVAGISKIIENMGLDPVALSRVILATPQENAA